VSRRGVVVAVWRCRRRPSAKPPPPPPPHPPPPPQRPPPPFPDLDKVPPGQESPVQVACMRGHVDALRALADKGARLDAQDRKDGVNAMIMVGVRHCRCPAS